MYIIQFKYNKKLVYLQLEQHLSCFDCCITDNPNHALKFKTESRAKKFSS